MFGKIETIQLDKLGLKEDDSIFLEPISDEQMFNVGCNMDAIRKADERINIKQPRPEKFGGDAQGQSYADWEFDFKAYSVSVN